MTRQARVLVVEDADDWRETLAGVLRDDGHLVREATTYKEAVTWLRSDIFHVAVVDLRLDEWDLNDFQGMDLIAQLRSLSEEGKGMSVVIVTGYGGLQEARDAFKPPLSVFDFLGKKEFDIEEYKSVIRDAIAAAYAGMANTGR